ncbi:hypothetical protein GCM10010193_02980 [Kitasatospora atroaurantiaca]|uniref:Uncharacterized protein n=1 Tax=Kitasatospora atroaurantiaca TaxID=285545 RepID=A0A561ELS3_9ACTN|nr:hypothetical protein [Kitasatospora atroaurantiaca]TWE16519.1 hypothetical protein FB465_1502 [Kitasatospora atroaurantiaca]
MATSRALEYLESPRNLVGCAAGAVGLGLHFAGLAGPWWPGVVAGLYGAGALLVPGRRQPEAQPLRELAERAELVGVPGSVGLDGLLAALAGAPGVERIVGWELPVALDGYVRARVWEGLEPGGVDAAAVLRAEVDRLTGVVARLVT